MHDEKLIDACCVPMTLLRRVGDMRDAELL
jgi:hypothetical protein